jgi:transcriptional regulator with XRE-family HTH domain
MAFKENLKNRRIELNLTLEDVAKLMNTSKPTIQRYESGVIENVPFDKVEQLADILQTTPSWLLGWEDASLTEEEKALLEKYNKLDEFGKHTINVVLEMEFNRCNK